MPRRQYPRPPRSSPVVLSLPGSCSGSSSALRAPREGADPGRPTAGQAAAAELGKREARAGQAAEGTEHHRTAWACGAGRPRNPRGRGGGEGSFGGGGRLPGGTEPRAVLLLRPQQVHLQLQSSATVPGNSGNSAQARRQTELGCARCHRAFILRIFNGGTNLCNPPPHRPRDAIILLAHYPDREHLPEAFASFFLP